MKKIVKYSTIRSQDLDQLTAFVNDGIAHGWQPYGSQNATLIYVDMTGQFAANGEPRIMYSQAVVQYEDQI